MSTRRNFLKQLALSFAALSPDRLLARPKAEPLLLFHSSETLSTWLPLPPEVSPYGSLGGYEARFRQITEARKSGSPFLLLDSGNFLCSSELADTFEGQVEWECMERLKYDALCLGERDADAGVAALQAQIRRSPIPVVSSNAADTAFRDLLKPHIIIKKGAFKIGIMGLNRDDSFLEVRSNPLAIANDKARELSDKHNCDLIICLSRLGQDEKEGVNDILLAANSANIHLIAGAETMMRNPHPIKLSNLQHREVWVLGNPKFGTHMNSMEYKISSAKTIFLSKAHTVEIGK